MIIKIENAIIYNEVTSIEMAIIATKFIELNIAFTLVFLYLCQTTVIIIAIIIDNKKRVYPRKDSVSSIVTKVNMKLINIPTAIILVKPTAIEERNGGDDELIFSYKASVLVPQDQQIRE